jgi:hypothetical protein
VLFIRSNAALRGREAMGCDIHPAIEYREAVDGKWRALMIPNKYFGKGSDEKELSASLDLDRNYDLFAILGNVRNGTGFAGCDTGDGFDPMSDNRGIPEDISDEAREALSDEHSSTWVTLSEILAYDWDRTTKSRGWVDAVTFEKWDRRKEFGYTPTSWSGGIIGAGIKHVSNEEMRVIVENEIGDKRGSAYMQAMEEFKSKYAAYYTQVEWDNSYSNYAAQLWFKVLPKMLNLGRVYGFDNVRLVMDFDS